MRYGTYRQAVVAAATMTLAALLWQHGAESSAALCRCPSLTRARLPGGPSKSSGGPGSPG